MQIVPNDDASTFEGLHDDCLRAAKDGASGPFKDSGASPCDPCLGNGRTRPSWWRNCLSSREAAISPVERTDVRVQAGALRGRLSSGRTTSSCPGRSPSWRRGPAEFRTAPTSAAPMAWSKSRSFRPGT